MKHFKTLFCALVCVLFASCQPAEQGEMLRGHLPAGIDEDILVSFTLTGDPFSTQNITLEADSTGLFTFSLDSIPGDGIDVTIGVDEWIYGARLEKGKTLDVYFTPSKENGYDARFEGENAKLSQFLTLYQQAYDVMKYFSPDPSESKSIAEYRQILEDENAKVVAAYDLLSDSQRDEYVRLAEGMYCWTKIRILMDQAENEDVQVEDYDEYWELSKDIDPNDIRNLRTNLTTVWLSNAHEKYTEEDGSDYYIESIQLIEKHITNPDVRSAMMRIVPLVFFTYTDGSADKTAFWEYYKEAAKDYPQYIEEFETRATAKAVECGEPMPYDAELTRPDGTTCHLSDLCGTLVYIDFWATWCGPCCKEIPHLERRVREFKGQPGVRFVSISMDTDHDAWLKKLDADKPEWEQFILSGDENRKLSEALQITGIPRFVLLAPDGSIIDPSAPRPSDETFAELINSNLK